MLSNNKIKGFTILEVMLALFVLTVGIGGSFALIKRAYIDISYAESKLIAAYLAQEGVEIVRNIRDGNWLEGVATPWDDGIDNCQSNCCEGDYTSISLVNRAACGYENLTLLNIDDQGFYSYSGTSATNFKRKIHIEPNGSEKLEVTVDVFWKDRGKVHNIQVVENLHDWFR